MAKDGADQERQQTEGTPNPSNNGQNGGSSAN